MKVTGSAHAQRFNWLLVNFVRQTDGVIDAVAVSSAGVLIAKSEAWTASPPISSPRSSPGSPDSPGARRAASGSSACDSS